MDGSGGAFAQSGNDEKELNKNLVPGLPFRYKKGSQTTRPEHGAKNKVQKKARYAPVEKKA